MGKQKIAWTLAALVAVACTMPAGGSGQPYTPKGNPWEPASGDAAAADAKSQAAADPKAAKPAPTAPAAPTASDKTPPLAETGTVLEQLEAAKARVAKLDAENGKLKTDNAALAAVVDQLKKENQNLAQAADSGAQGRQRIDQEMEALRQQVKEMESRARQLADDVLQERILRVRVERELILAKVQEAENAEGGN
jgi:predicted RNase H-like nuclease (RuvC/YqgF family)